MWSGDFNAGDFQLVAVGVGALLAGLAAFASAGLISRSNRKNREQNAAIANAQAEALRVQADLTSRIAAQTHEIKVSIDGRMDELLVITRELATAKAEAKAEETAKVLRNETVVSDVASAVVDRIGEAADRAAQTVPHKGP